MVSSSSRLQRVSTGVSYGDTSRPPTLLHPTPGGGSRWWLPARQRKQRVQREVEWRLPVGCDFSGGAATRQPTQSTRQI